MVLETSKANVAKHYAVVGVLEMWDETLEVMENTLPFFFSGKCMRYLNIRVSSVSTLYVNLSNFCAVQVPKKCTRSNSAKDGRIKTYKKI